MAEKAAPLGRPGKARPKLLEAAIQEFAESGFDGATTAAIARRAKAPQPLVHHHFGSKEQLFHEVLDRLFEEFNAEVLGGEVADVDLAEIVRRLTRFTARRPELARIWMIECSRRGPHARYVIDKHIGPLTEMMRPRLVDAARRGDLPDIDASVLLYAALGLISYPFLVTEQVRRLSGEDPLTQQFADRYADAALAILGLAHSPRPAAPARQTPKPSPKDPAPDAPQLVSSSPRSRKEPS
jgi:AcrR family transcriptional regulator